jgi:hypothetical protein
MSLNHLLSNELKLEVVDVSFGTGQLKTKSYDPTILLTNGNTLSLESPFIYTCDEVSLRIRGYCNYLSSVTPQNNFSATLTLPTELQSRFATGQVYANGWVNEVPNNDNINNGVVASGIINGDGEVDCRIFYRQNQTTAIAFRINFDIVIYSVAV